MRRWSKPEVLVLAGLIAAGAALRFATLGDRSFWVDEGLTVRLMHLPFGDMLHLWRRQEDNPPLYYVVAWVWTRVFGSGEVGLRSLSAVLGTATIPVAYAATARLASRRAGLVAAALAAVSPMLVWFSQDGRSYSLLVLLSGLSFLAFLRARERPSPGRLAAWALPSAGALATHYYAVFPIAAEAVFLLWGHRRNRAVWAAVTAPAVVLAALVPIAVSQRSGGVAVFLRGSSLASRAVQVPAQYVVGFQPPAQVAVSLLAFLGIVVAVYLLLTRTDARERAGAALAAAVGLAAVLGPAVVALVPRFDYLLTRITSAGWVPLAAAVAIGLGARRAGLIGAAALVWLCGFSVAIDVVTADHPKFDHDDWRAAARAVGTAPGPRVLAVNPASGSVVLPLYVKGARFTRGAPGRVVEIDVIGLPPPTRRIGHAPRPPRPPTPPAPPGFALAQRRDAPTYTLVRYRAARPEAVSRLRLDALALSRAEPPSLLVVAGGG
jgi:mannosyltransferase